MKNKINKYFIVAISIFVGILHIKIGADYQGIFKVFIRSYLIDILLPFNIYLLLQIGLRDYFSVINSKIIGAVLTFTFGVFTELAQLNNIPFFGNTYDPIDIVMYSIGVGFGLLIDYTIIEKLEKQQK